MRTYSVLLCVLAVIACVATSTEVEVDEFGEALATPSDGQSVEAAFTGTVDSESAAANRPTRKAKMSEVVRGFGALEYAGIGLIVLYLLNYLYGRSTNMSIANSWAAAFFPFLSEQFSKVGPARPMEEWDPSKPESILLHDALHKFSCFCTGRRYCQGVAVDLNLQKRQDLASLLIGVFLPEHDGLELVVVMEEDAMEPFVMAIAPSKACKTLRTDHADLKDFTGLVTVQGLDESLSVLGEDGAVASKILAPQILKLLGENASLVESIHMTDQNATPVPGWKEVPKKVLRFKYRLPGTSAAAIEETRAAMEMTLQIVDWVGSTKFVPFAKNKALERRKEMENLRFKQTHQQRQEAAQQKKLEKIQREKQMYESMSDDAKAKYDAKEAKRKQKEAQKKAGRVKMIKA